MFQERLNELREAVPGTMAVCLAAGDGISIESVGGDKIDLEVLVAELVSMARGMESDQRALGLGETARFEVVSERYSLILTRVSEGYYMLMVIEAGRPIGRARFEMRRASPAFEEDLV